MQRELRRCIARLISRPPESGFLQNLSWRSLRRKRCQTRVFTQGRFKAVTNVGKAALKRPRPKASRGPYHSRVAERLDCGASAPLSSRDKSAPRTSAQSGTARSHKNFLRLVVPLCGQLVDYGFFRNPLAASHSSNRSIHLLAGFGSFARKWIERFDE